MDLITFRGVERLLVVLIGGLSIFLGYHLFLSMPQQPDGEGKVVLPGGVSIYVSRVGPGVFFAMFGAVVLSLSLYHSLRYTKDQSRVSTLNAATPQATVADAPTPRPAHSPVPLVPPVPASLSSLAHHSEREEVRYSIPPLSRAPDPVELKELEASCDFINRTLPSLLKPSLNPTQQRDLQRTVRRIKLDLIEAKWTADWGDFKDFKDWARGGGHDPPPPSQQTPADLYHHGMEIPP